MPNDTTGVQFYPLIKVQCSSIILEQCRSYELSKNSSTCADTVLFPENVSDLFEQIQWRKKWFEVICISTHFNHLPTIYKLFMTY